MNHFNISKDHEMVNHDGIYHTNYIRKNGRIVQLIMLDLRTFRSDLLIYTANAKLPRDKYFYTLDYLPHTSEDSILVGETQWKWLEQELQKPADIRLICSGSQFSIEYNGYEAWANFPHEQKRMIDLINKVKANGVLFLSGDVHYAEISKLKNEKGYDLLDVTSSGITSTWDFPTQNSNRIEGPVMENNFGLITINWNSNPDIKIEIIDRNKNQRIEYSINKSTLKHE
jgi:alkaline phosphatase D